MDDISFNNVENEFARDILNKYKPAAFLMKILGLVGGISWVSTLDWAKHFPTVSTEKH